MKLAIVILAGGKAPRMGGGDKPLKEIAGRTILSRVIERLDARAPVVLRMIRDGRKIIWCNFFPAAGEGKDEFRDWRKERVEVEDGGFHYWKIEYDPTTGKCSKFYPNGYA